MNFHIFRTLGSFVVPFMLTAVVLTPVSRADPFEETSLRLLIRGMDPNAALASEARLVGTLKEFGVPRQQGNTIGQWIAAIQSANAGRGAAVLNGLGGIPSRTLLWTAQQTLNANGAYVGPPVATVSGRIEETCEDEDGNQIAGYEFDALRPS